VYILTFRLMQVRQYKHERECNSIIQQAREEKISRLEALVDGAISSEEFLKDELSLLAFEHKVCCILCILQLSLPSLPGKHIWQNKFCSLE
jgi:hypothetical protein